MNDIFHQLKYWQHMQHPSPKVLKENTKQEIEIDLSNLKIERRNATAQLKWTV